MWVSCWKTTVSEAPGIWPVFITFVSEAEVIGGRQKAAPGRQIGLIAPPIAPRFFFVCFCLGGGGLDSILVEMQWDLAEKSWIDPLRLIADTW